MSRTPIVDRCVTAFMVSMVVCVGLMIAFWILARNHQYPEPGSMLFTAIEYGLVILWPVLTFFILWITDFFYEPEKKAIPFNYRALLRLYNWLFRGGTL